MRLRSNHTAAHGSSYVGCTLLITNSSGMPSRIVRVTGFDREAAAREGDAARPFTCRGVASGQRAYVGCTMILAADEDGNPEETVRVRAYDAEARARGEEGPFQVEYLDGPEMGNVMWETDTLITTSRLLAPSDALTAAPDLSDSPAAVWSTETEHVVRAARLMARGQAGRPLEAQLALMKTIGAAETRATSWQTSSLLDSLAAFLRHSCPLTTASRDVMLPTRLPAAALVAGTAPRERRGRFEALARAVAVQSGTSAATSSSSKSNTAARPPPLRLHTVLLSSHACRDEASAIRTIMEQLRRGAAAAIARPASAPSADELKGLRGEELVDCELCFPIDVEQDLPEEQIRVVAYDATRGEENAGGQFHVEYLDGDREGDLDWEDALEVYGSRLVRRSDERSLRATAARAQAEASLRRKVEQRTAVTSSSDELDAPSLFTLARWFSARQERRTAAAQCAAADALVVESPPPTNLEDDAVHPSLSVHGDGLVVIFEDFESFDVGVLNRLLECMLLLRGGSSGSGGRSGSDGVPVGVVLGLATSMIDATLARYLGWAVKSTMLVRHFHRSDPVAAMDTLFESLIIGSEWCGERDDSPLTTASTSANTATASTTTSASTASAQPSPDLHPLPLWFSPRVLLNLREGFSDTASMTHQIACLTVEHCRAQVLSGLCCCTRSTTLAPLDPYDFHTLQHLKSVGAGHDENDITKFAGRLREYRAAWGFALRTLRALVVELGLPPAAWGCAVSRDAARDAAEERKHALSRASLCAFHIAAQRGELPKLVPAVAAKLKVIGSQHRPLEKITRIISAFGAFQSRLERANRSRHFGVASWDTPLFKNAEAASLRLTAALREAEAIAKEPPTAGGSGSGGGSAAASLRAWSGKKRRRMALNAGSGGGRYSLEQWNSTGVMKASELIAQFAREFLHPVSELPLHELCFCSGDGATANGSSASGMGAALSAERDATLTERHFAPQMRLSHITPLIFPTGWLASSSDAIAEGDMPDVSQLYMLYNESTRSIDIAGWFTSFASVQGKADTDPLAGARFIRGWNYLRRTGFVRRAPGSTGDTMDEKLVYDERDIGWPT